MREFSWKYFTLTGSIEAYLLYREHAQSKLESSSDVLSDMMADMSETDSFSSGSSV